jgi:AbrB family looped-hinge helix DNA binding protein
MRHTRLSSKYQIVIPTEMRKVLRVEAGDEITLVERGGVVYLLPREASAVKELRGLARGRLRYPKRYLKKERRSW